MAFYFPIFSIDRQHYLVILYTGGKYYDVLLCSTRKEREFWIT